MIGPARSRAERLRDEIAQAILSGDLCPGERLDEHGLAQRYAVSRTPVREALKQLAGIDLVELRPHRGAVVAELHQSRIGELFEALAEAEAVCARLAAIKMSGFERERLEVLHATCTGALTGGDQEAIPTTNRALHEAIYAGAHNAFLADCVQGLRRRLMPFSRAQFRLAERPLQSAREHEQVMAAIRRRDGEGAADVMRRHILAVGHAWQAWAADSEAQVAAVAAK
jgi:DNA-binding GntR family transcriptional regulator